MAQYDDDNKKYVYAGEKPGDTSSYKRFPKDPSTWDSVKETFEPNETRIMLEQIRKRRQSSN